MQYLSHFLAESKWVGVSSILVNQLLQTSNWVVFSQILTFLNLLKWVFWGYYIAPKIVKRNVQVGF